MSTDRDLEERLAEIDRQLRSRARRSTETSVWVALLVLSLVGAVLFAAGALFMRALS